MQKHSHALPTVTDLLLSSTRLYKQFFSIFFRYASWLLVPIAINVIAVSTLPESIAEWIVIVNWFIAFGILHPWLAITFTLLLGQIKEKIVLPDQLGEIAWRYFFIYIFVFLAVLIATLLGAVAFIIPGLFVCSILGFSPFILLLEKTNVKDALKESLELTKGRIIKVTYRFLSGLILIQVLEYVFAFLIFATLVYFVNHGHTEYNLHLIILYDTLQQIFHILFIPLYIIYPTLLYFSLKNDTIGNV